MSARSPPILGLRANQRHNTIRINEDDPVGGYAQRRHDPTRVYPPDLPGDEAGENGRVWKIYRDRVGDIDDEMLQGWDDALTTLLVFAGLFSAACTAFLIEVSKSLQPDWQRATSLAVFAIYVHLNSTSSPPFEVQNPLLFTPSLDARWINGLWFTSLTLSLVVSLLAILAKQWLNEFKLRTRKPASSPKAWALRHSVFKGGLERWGVDAMISILPLLLHAALFLFLIGLCIMLFPLDDCVAGAVIGISGAVSVFYVVAGVAPVFWTDCPSATPALRYAYTLWNFVVIPAVIWVLFTVAFLLFLVLFSVSSLLSLVFVSLTFLLRLVPPSLSSFFLSFDRSNTVDTGLARSWQDIWRSFSLNSEIASDFSDLISEVPGYVPGSAKPKFDGADIFAKDQLLREASVLAWMIRMLPAQDDVTSALYVVGILSAETVLHRKEEDNPLFHEDLRRVAKDALNGIITRNSSSEIDDETIAILLRACIIVSRHALQLSEPVRSFLQEAMSRNALEHDLIFKLTSYASDSFFSSFIRREDGIETRVYLWEIIRLAILASSICQPPFLPSAVTAFNDSVRHALGEPSPPNITDPKLLFIATSDKLLCSIMDGWESLGTLLISACAAAARELNAAHATTPLPPNLQNKLRFISTSSFLSCKLSAADLSAITAFLVRPGSHIPPLALHHILYHFQKEQLPIGVDELTWIRAAFQPPPVASDLMDTLSVFPFTDDALHTSRLTLLEPVQFTDMEGGVTNYPSPWSILLAIRQTPETTELVAEMTCAYTVLLLALYRRGHVVRAQTMLRKLLPRKRCAAIIAHGIEGRYHLALHAKLIDSARWGKLRDKLISHGEWTSHPPLVHPDVSSFIEAVEAANDCLECVPAGVAPPLVVVPPPAGDAPEDSGTAMDDDATDNGGAAAEDAAGNGGTVTDDDAAETGGTVDDAADSGAATDDDAAEEGGPPPDDAAEGVGAAPRIQVTSSHPPAAEGGAARTYNPRGAEEV